MYIFQKLTNLYGRIKSTGHTEGMDGYEKQKLAIFNQINFFGVLTGIGIPLSAIFGEGYLPPLAWIVAFSPTVISSAVLICNYYRRYELAMMIYFILYPVVTALVYAGSIDAGIELFFILYAILSVFYLQHIRNVVLAFALSFACYFCVFVFNKNYQFRLEEINFIFYLLNQFIAVAFIFMSMYLIKKENYVYQKQILAKNNALRARNEQIASQRKEIADKAAVLEQTTEQLTELNGLKNKLFSVISHDLKTPVYALRNLFRNVIQYDLPGDDIKALVPDIMNDLNYTTGLMENLLQWAKSQMQGDSLNLQLLDVSGMIQDTAKLLRLQAETKKVHIKLKDDQPVYIFADKDMIDLVLRNLLSNAIKFTPTDGEVIIGAAQTASCVEIFVQDTGTGISPENIDKLFGNSFYTTKGTSNETGTGLGLKLCKEFLQKNGGDIFVESQPGKGSRFKFTLPTP